MPHFVKPPSAPALSACTSRWCMTMRCSIFPAFISGGLGALWNMVLKASTGFCACACSTSRPAQRSAFCESAGRGVLVSRPSPVKISPHYVQSADNDSLEQIWTRVLRLTPLIGMDSHATGWS